MRWRPSWLGDQHQRRHVPRSVVGLRDGHGLDVHDERREQRRAAEQNRPADRGRVGRGQGTAHQPLQTSLVGGRASAQRSVPVRQPVAVPEDVAGAVVDLQDPPAPVQMNDAYPRIVEQAGHGRASRPGAHQCLADADELPDVARQFRNHRDSRSPPTDRVHRVTEAPGDAGAVGAVEPHSQAVLAIAPRQRLVVGGRALQLLGRVQVPLVDQTAVGQTAGIAARTHRWRNSSRGTRAPDLRGVAPVCKSRRRGPGRRPSGLRRRRGHCP